MKKLYYFPEKNKMAEMNNKSVKAPRRVMTTSTRSKHQGVKTPPLKTPVSPKRQSDKKLPKKKSSKKKLAVRSETKEQVDTQERPPCMAEGCKYKSSYLVDEDVYYCGRHANVNEYPERKALYGVRTNKSRKPEHTCGYVMKNKDGDEVLCSKGATWKSDDEYFCARHRSSDAEELKSKNKRTTGFNCLFTPNCGKNKGIQCNKIATWKKDDFYYCLSHAKNQDTNYNENMEKLKYKRKGSDLVCSELNKSKNESCGAKASFRITSTGNMYCGRHFPKDWDKSDVEELGTTKTKLSQFEVPYCQTKNKNQTNCKNKAIGSQNNKYVCHRHRKQEEELTEL